MPQIIRSSRQASNIFGLGGNYAPRPKNLFYVSFTTNPNISVSSSLTDISFLVKSCDRPQIQPQTEELNQYNKKRLVHTGIKYAPLRIVFYDTVDNLLMQMWNAYAQNYFGSFGHANYPTDFDYDATITNATTGLNFADSAGTGYGFAPVAASSSTTDNNAAFFFRTISIYEVYGDQYVQTDIINPRITAFDPESMSYDDSQISTISMTVNYEAVVYQNNAASQQLTASNSLTSAFGGLFNGDTIDLPDDTSTNGDTSTYKDYTFANQTASTSPYLLNTTFDIPEQEYLPEPYLDDRSVVSDGPLATYGDYVFGDAQLLTIQNYNAQADLLGAALTNSVVASALNATQQQALSQYPGNQYPVTVAIPNAALPSDQADVAVAAVSALSGAPTVPNTSYYVQQIAAGAMNASTSFSMPREQIFTQNPANVTAPNSWDSTTPDASGIALSPSTYGVLNAARPASAQIGFNSRTFRSQSG